MGARLARSLAAGWRPAPIPAHIPLGPTEAMYYQMDVQFLQYAAANVSYSQGAFLAGGSVGWMAASLAGSAMYNSSQRKRAAAQAAAQWRFLYSGRMYITNERLGCQIRTGWRDIYYSAIRALECELDGVVIFLNGTEPLKLRSSSPYWYYALLRFLAWGEVVQFDIPDDLAARAAQTEAALPPGP